MAREVVEERGQGRPRPHGVDALGRQRRVAEQEGAADLVAEGVVGGGVAEVADVRGFRAVQVDAGDAVQLLDWVGGDAELVRGAHVGGVFGVLLGGVVASIGWFAVSAAAQVVGDVAAAVVVVGVVDHGVDLAAQMAAGVDGVQGAEPTSEGPRREPEFVAVVLRREAGGSVRLIQARVHHERAFGLQRLRGVLHQRFPVVGDVVGEADSRAPVRGVVPVVLHQRVVARAVYGFRARQHGPVADGVAVHHLGARREGGGNVVHPAALVVAVHDDPGGQRVAERQVRVGVGTAAVGAAAGRRVARLEARGKAGRVRLAGDEPQVARLGAGAEQGSLRASKHFDAFQIGCEDVQIAPAEGDRLFVHIERDARRGALRRADGDARLLRGAAADVDFLLAGAVAGGDHVRQVFHVLVEGLGADLAQRVAGDRLQGDGDVLRALHALGGGDHDGLQASGVLRLLDFLRRNRRGGGDGGRDGEAQARPRPLILGRARGRVRSRKRLLAPIHVHDSLERRTLYSTFVGEGQCRARAPSARTPKSTPPAGSG